MRKTVSSMPNDFDNEDEEKKPSPGPGDYLADKDTT